MSEVEGYASRKTHQLGADVEERQEITGFFVGSCPFVNGTTSSLALSPEPADKLWFLGWVNKGGIKGRNIRYPCC